MKTRWRRAGTAAEVICVAGMCVGGVLVGADRVGDGLVALVVAIIAALVGVGCDLRAAKRRDLECDQ